MITSILEQKMMPKYETTSPIQEIKIVVVFI